jgi:hypothetical protein
MKPQVTFEELESFLRQSPPRDVPRNLARRKSGGSAFGVLLPFGLFFFVFGAFFVWIFFPWNLPAEISLSWFGREQATGRVVATESTNMSVNDQPVSLVRYRFRTREGEDKLGASYFSQSVPQVGDELPIRYRGPHPDWNRAEGGTIDPFGWFGVFTILFPAIGLILVGIMIRSRRRWRRLLRDGQFAMANVRDLQPTGTVVMGDTIYRVSLDFEGGLPVASIEANIRGDDVRLAREYLDSNEPIAVLCDPADHRRLTFPESMLTD